MKLRPYQLEASQAVLRAWQTHRSTLMVMATGGGKTVVAADIASKAPGRFLYLANRNELCSQPLATFAKYLNYIPALEKSESHAPLDARIVIGSVQTMSRAKRLQRFPEDHFTHILADEAHMSVAPSWQRILNHFKAAKIVGVTATPMRGDLKSLTDVFESEASRHDLFTLVDQGYLCSPDNVERLSTAISLAQVRIKKGPDGADYDPQDSANAVEPFFREIARELKDKYVAKHILVFLPLIATSQKFAWACQSEGLRCEHIDGQDTDRDAKLQRFRDGQTMILSNAALLNLGVDIPLIDCVLNLRPTRSQTLYVQTIGRCTRTLPGTIDGIETAEGRLEAISKSQKPFSTILDPLWLSDDLSLVTPNFLVAPDEEFALDMAKKAPSSYSLRALAADIQRQREEELAAKLAANFQAGLDWRYFAAASGEHRLLQYRPVLRRETAPPTRFSRVLLFQRGINPDSVQTEGEAREVLQALGRRAHQGRLAIRELSLFAATVSNDELWRLTKDDLLERTVAGPQR